MSIERTAPRGWDIARLEDVVDILDSKRVPINAKERETRVGQVPYYGATGQVGWIDDYLFDEELVLLGEDGAPFLDAAKQKAYVVRGKSWVNNHVHVLRARSDIPNAYIKYYLDTVDYHEFVTGTTRLKLNQAAMRRIPVPLAPPNERARIVAEIEKQFSRLDEAVANFKRVKANLKRYKASVLKAAVEGKLTEDWRKQHPNVEPASKLLERILAGRLAKWNGKGKYKDPVKTNTAKPLMLPVEWEWTSLDSLTAQIGDVDHKMPKAIDGGIPYISTKDFTGDNQIDFDKAKTISITDYERLARKIKPEPGDILLSRYGTVGETRVVPTKPIFQASYSIAILKPLIPFVNTKYLPVVLRSQQLKSEMSENVRASSQPDLGLEYIRKLSIPLPSLGEQELIVAEVERRLSVIEELEVAAEANLTRADRLRQSILATAFAGKLLRDSRRKVSA